MSLENKKVGLALGGGAALGATHIGVLKAIDELNIEVSYVSGTSIGALIAALFAFEMNHKAIEKISEQLKWGDIAGMTLSKYGLLSNNKMEDLILENIGDVNFDQSGIPIAIIATNVSNGQKVVIKEGRIAPAVMASTCIPGIFIPTEINDQLLVDGGIVENVPISPLNAMGADVVIAVDLNSGHTYDRPKNIIDVLLNSFHFTMMSASKIQTNTADVLIKPDLSSFSRTNIDQTKELIDIGYKEAKKVLKNYISL